MSDVGQFIFRAFSEIGRADLDQNVDWREAALAGVRNDGVDAVSGEADGGTGRALAVAVAGSPDLAFDLARNELDTLTGEIAEGWTDDKISSLTGRVTRAWSVAWEEETPAPASSPGLVLGEYRSVLFYEMGETRQLLLTMETQRPTGQRDIHAVSYYDPADFADES